MDHPNSDISAPEGGATGEPLDSSVRDRVLRLHPLAGDGGLSGTVMRKASGWEQAGAFAAEIMGRFRSPGEVTPPAMPLATPVAESRATATVSAPSSATPSVHQRLLPAAGSSSSGTMGSGSFVQRKAENGQNSAAPNKAAGMVAEQSVGPDSPSGTFQKKIGNSVGYDVNHDVSPEPLSLPVAARTLAMTARLGNTLGARLVQRHSGFAGSTSPDAKASLANPFPFSLGEGVSLAGSSALNKSVPAGYAEMRGQEARPFQRKMSPANVRISVAKRDGAVNAAVQSGAPVGIEPTGGISGIGSVPNPAAVGAASRVCPPSTGRTQGFAPAPVKTDAVQLRPEPLAIAHPLVKPVSPATATPQRKVGVASLADDIFARLPNNPSGAAIDGVPSAMITQRSGGSSSPAVSPASVVAPIQRAARRDGATGGEGSLPVIRQASPGGGASGVVSRKAKDAATGPALFQGRNLPGASETASERLAPRVELISGAFASGPVASSESATSGRLPLAQLQGVVGLSSGRSAGSGEGGAIQRKQSRSLPVVQRSEATGASAIVTPSSGTSESATAFAPSGPSEPGAGTLTPGAPIDLERVADEVYRIIERRLIVEKENRGL